MHVTSKIPCGNGNILWHTPDHFEVEVIAYSKGPRYAYFKVCSVSPSHHRTITLRPDSRFPANFSGLSAKIWMKRGQNGSWQALPENDVLIEPQAIRFSIKLEPGEEYFFSTEPAREYSHTTSELFEIAHALGHEAAVHMLGHSVEHRPIVALRITAPENIAIPGQEECPVILITAGEHASEFSGEELVRGMLALVAGESGKALRRDFIFDFILNTNPDGNYHGWHQYNAKDWAEHNYAEVVDRSWHHEFEEYMSDTGQSPSEKRFSPETIALGNWILKTHPTLFISAHSWLSHGGNPGAFYADPSILPEGMKKFVPALNEEAVQASAIFDLEFQTYPTSNLCGGHLGAFLMKNELAISYTIEGHMNPGREILQALGNNLLTRWLANPILNLRKSRRPQWRAWEERRTH